LIKEDLRDVPWSIGVMEYWNDGLREEKNNRSIPFDFSTQYSSFPLFHHSMWMAPTSPADYAHGQQCSPKTEETPVSMSSGLLEDFINPREGRNRYEKQW